MTLNRSMFSALSSHALLRGRQTGRAQGRRGQHLRPATRQLLPQELRSIHPLPAPSKGTGGTGTEVAWELGAGLCVQPPRDTAARGRRTVANSPGETLPCRCAVRSRKPRVSLATATTVWRVLPEREANLRSTARVTSQEAMGCRHFLKHQLTRFFMLPSWLVSAKGPYTVFNDRSDHWEAQPGLTCPGDCCISFLGERKGSEGTRGQPEDTQEP